MHELMVWFHVFLFIQELNYEFSNKVLSLPDSIAAMAWRGSTVSAPARVLFLAPLATSFALFCSPIVPHRVWCAGVRGVFQAAVLRAASRRRRGASPVCHSSVCLHEPLLWIAADESGLQVSEIGVPWLKDMPPCVEVSPR
jgi:hypothetical protein